MYDPKSIKKLKHKNVELLLVARLFTNIYLTHNNLSAKFPHGRESVATMFQLRVAIVVEIESESISTRLTTHSQPYGN